MSTTGEICQRSAAVTFALALTTIATVVYLSGY